MSNIHYLNPRVKRARLCIGCGEPLPKDAPRHHYACRRCFGFSRFREAVDEFRRGRL